MKEGEGEIKHPIKHYIEYYVLLIFGFLLSIIPLRLALLLGWLIAFIFHKIFKFRKKEALKRIIEVTGDKYSKKEICYIAWISWRNLCFNAIELIRINSLTEKKAKESDLGKSLSSIRSIVKDKGAILSTIHMGNWDLSGVTLDLLGFPIFSIARRQKNHLTDAYLNKKRAAFNLDVLFNDRSSLKKIIQRINNGEVFIILPDVRNPRPGQEISFLGGTANLGSGTAAFAKSCTCPIIPFIIRRNGWLRHEATILKPINPDAALDKNEDIKKMMSELMHVFGKEIYTSPEQYFWYNKRWVLERLN